MCTTLVTLRAVTNGWLYASAATLCGMDCSQPMPCLSPTSLAGVLGLWGLRQTLWLGHLMPLGHGCSSWASVGLSHGC